jgi:hypothetical protein
MKVVVQAGWAGLAGLFILVSPGIQAADLSSAVAVVRAVGAEGQGNAAAAAAWRTLSGVGPAELPQLLAAMDGANDYAANWLRSAVEVVAQRAGAGGPPLPLAALREFLGDTRHHPRARRLAFELVRSADPTAARELLPRFRDDPSVELRRDAVQALVEGVAKAEAGIAVPRLREALAAARDVDQIESIAKRLGELGDKVDLQATFGWVTQWQLVAPFDNVGGAGFERAYPPELKLELTGELPGKTGPVTWRTYQTTNEYGLVNFNQPFGPLKGAAGYAVAEFRSERAQPAEIRLGSKNGWKVWFNGQYQFGRDEYHRGVEIDQYRIPVQLRAGTNQILVKLCQNEQTEDWASEWEFQLRVTDALGTPIRSVR